MANIAEGLEKIVTVVGKAINEAQKAVDKVLWGNVNDSPAIPPPGTQAPTTPKKSQVGSFIQSGLFNALNALNSVDLCNILDYLSNKTSKLKIKRKENPTKIEKALYDLQDKAALVREAIDSFYAFPNDVLTQLKDPNPEAAPAPGTTPETGATPPANQLGGSKMQKYNLGIVGKYISDIFKFARDVQQGTQGAIATTNQFTLEALGDPEVAAALSVLPGFKSNINAIQDFTSIIDKYADFRQIPNEDFQKILKKLDQLRGVCIAIEQLSVGGAIDLAEQFIGNDIRSQIAKLNQYLDPTKLVPTLKQINNSLQSFIKTCNVITTNLRVARGFVKIALVLIKIFRFIAKLIGLTPAPLMYATYSMVDKIRDAKDTATKTTTGLEKFLQQLNALLAVIIQVVRYIQQNTQVLLQYLEVLLAQLQSCKSLDNSDIVKQLQTTQKDLIALNDELTGIVRDYDTKINKSEDAYGKYTIRVVDEELVDDAITNKRRRGIALDSDGAIVAQSDLTFATNKAIIIEEVKFKLVQLGLVPAESLSPTDLVVAESLLYLDDDALLLDDLDVPTSTLESPDSQNQNAGIGLSGYLNQIKGTSALRKRVRAKMQATSAVAKRSIAASAVNTSKFLGVVNRRGG